MRIHIALLHMLPLLILGAITIAAAMSIPALRTPLASSLVAVTILLMALRPVERKVAAKRRSRTRVLLVGNQPTARKYIEEVEAHPRRGYTIVGLVVEDASRPQFSPYLELGTLDELATIVASVKPDRIVLALSDRRGRMPLRDLLEFQAAGIVVEDVLTAFETCSEKVPIEVVTPGYLLTHGVRKSRMLQRSQRMISWLTATAVLILTAPILALIAIAIQIDSGGPVLFRQLRIGKGGRPFKLLKFRTMRPVDLESSLWACDNRARITRFGQFLRRFRLDELPQLVNVIKGDMNLVGPRPHPVSNISLFREAIPYYVLRCSVLPGITGWAQTRYCYANNLEQETEKMKYDLYYITHMSFWMDLKIILRTFARFTSSEAEPLTPQRAMSPYTPVRLHARKRSRRAMRPLSIAAVPSTVNPSAYPTTTNT